MSVKRLKTAPGGVDIRPADDEELAKVVAMYDLLFEAPGTRPPDWDPAVALARLRRLHAGPRGVILVATSEDGIVGFCTVALDIESVRFGQRAWVEDLAVETMRRSEGIGRRLLAAAKAWAHQEGATHLELDSAESRHDAHRFYQREAPNWRSVCYGWTLSD